MKKTIQDLKIGDSVWSQNSDKEPVEWKVDLISSLKIVLKSNLEYNREASRRQEDLTSFKFVGYKDGNNDSYYNLTFYTEKIDALKAYRQKQDDNIEKVFKEQICFLEKIKALNESIRKTDQLIAYELTKTQ